MLFLQTFFKRPSEILPFRGRWLAQRDGGGPSGLTVAPRRTPSVSPTPFSRFILSLSNGGCHLPRRGRILALRIAAPGALAILPGIAHAAEPPCLTPSEFTAMATYALPSVITGTVQRCDAALGPDAFLKTDGAALAARYSASKANAWPGAKAAFLKLTGGGDPSGGNLVKGLSDPAMQEIVDTAITAKVADALPVEHCGTVNRLLKLLAPLPPESTAGVIALAVGLGTKSGRHIGPFAVCPA